MYKVRFKSIIFLLSLLGPIYAAETDYSAEKENKDLETAKELVEIQPNEILPLILLINKKNEYWYQFPEKSQEIVLQDGRIANGTKFVSSKLDAEQAFFCPRVNSENDCLELRTFQSIDYLQCYSQPVPKLQNAYNRCGEENMDFVFELMYNICKNEDKRYKFDRREIPFYQICYNQNSNKVLYTFHKIRSPELLDSKLLTRERSITYDITSSYNEDDDENVEKIPPTEEEIALMSTSYQRQYLVPPGDMAFATWRKTTFNDMNIEWQHKKLIDLWDEIAANIRSVVNKYITDKNQGFLVNTAVVDINSIAKDDNQLSNIWVKMVTVMKSSEIQPSHGLAIIMNNFVNNDDDKSSTPNDTEIAKYCDENLCIDELIRKFNDVGGGIRCCHVTPQISKIFEYGNTYIKEELYVPNVTITEDQETLYDSITLDQAAKSLQKIQRTEMLPMILSFDPDDFKLYFPTRIDKVITKNKRIVQGSEFSTAIRNRQIFFCPKEKCLVPQEFGRFQPLQCSKEPEPMVREITGERNKCGFEAAGTLYKVIYEICLEQEPYPYSTTNTQFYEFCYNPKKKKVLSLDYRILSPKLISSTLLLNEREIEQYFTMITDDITPISNSQDQSNQSTNTVKPGYKLEYLMPPEDMAFGLWKKTAYRRVNAEWQHEKLTPLWHEINNHIRDYASMVEIHQVTNVKPFQNYFTRGLGSLKNDYIGTYVYTGVFDIEYESEKYEDDDQESNIWVKVVYSEGLVPSEAVVILMNNFIVTKEQSSTSPNSKENVIQKYCKVISLCLEDVEKAFENIGGRIKCCPMTIEIQRLFGSPIIDYSNVGLLSIPKLTK